MGKHFPLTESYNHGEEMKGVDTGWFVLCGPIMG